MIDVALVPSVPIASSLAAPAASDNNARPMNRRTGETTTRKSFTGGSSTSSTLGELMRNDVYSYEDGNKAANADAAAVAPDDDDDDDDGGADDEMLLLRAQLKRERREHQRQVDDLCRQKAQVELELSVVDREMQKKDRVKDYYYNDTLAKEEAAGGGGGSGDDDDDGAAAATTVPRLQAQLCQSLHEKRVLEERLVVVKKSSDSIIASLNEELTELADEQSKMEVTFMNELAAVNRAYEGRLKDQRVEYERNLEEIRLEIKRREQQWAEMSVSGSMKSGDGLNGSCSVATTCCDEGDSYSESITLSSWPRSIDAIREGPVAHQPIASPPPTEAAAAKEEEENEEEDERTVLSRDKINDVTQQLDDLNQQYNEALATNDVPMAGSLLTDIIEKQAQIEHMEMQLEKEEEAATRRRKELIENNDARPRPPPSIASSSASASYADTNIMTAQHMELRLEEEARRQNKGLNIDSDARSVETEGEEDDGKSSRQVDDDDGERSDDGEHVAAIASLSASYANSNMTAEEVERMSLSLELDDLTQKYEEAVEGMDVEQADLILSSLMRKQRQIERLEMQQLGDDKAAWSRRKEAAAASFEKDEMEEDGRSSSRQQGGEDDDEGSDGGEQVAAASATEAVAATAAEHRKQEPATPIQSPDCQHGRRPRAAAVSADNEATPITSNAALRGKALDRSSNKEEPESQYDEYQYNYDEPACHDSKGQPKPPAVADATTATDAVANNSMPSTLSYCPTNDNIANDDNDGGDDDDETDSVLSFRSWAVRAVDRPVNEPKKADAKPKIVASSSSDRSRSDGDDEGEELEPAPSTTTTMTGDDAFGDRSVSLSSQTNKDGPIDEDDDDADTDAGSVISFRQWAINAVECPVNGEKACATREPITSVVASFVRRRSCDGGSGKRDGTKEEEEEEEPTTMAMAMADDDLAEDNAATDGRPCYFSSSSSTSLGGLLEDDGATRSIDSIRKAGTVIDNDLTAQNQRLKAENDELLRDKASLHDEIERLTAENLGLELQAKAMVEELEAEASSRAARRRDPQDCDPSPMSDDGDDDDGDCRFTYLMDVDLTDDECDGGSSSPQTKMNAEKNDGGVVFAAGRKNRRKQHPIVSNETFRPETSSSDEEEQQEVARVEALKAAPTIERECQAIATGHELSDRQEKLLALQICCEDEKAKNEDLTARNRLLSDTNETLCREKTRLEQQVEELTAAKQEHESEAKSEQMEHELSMVALAEGLKVAQEACEVAKRENEDLTLQNRQLTEDNEATCREKASQEVTIEALTTAKLERENEMKAVQEELESNVAGLAEELKVAQEACEVAKRKNEDLTLQNRQLTEDNEAMCREKASQEVTIEALTTAKLEQENEMKAVQEELESNVAGLAEELKVAQEACEVAKTEKEDLTLQNQQLTEKIEAMYREKESQEVTIEALTAAKLEQERDAKGVKEGHELSMAGLAEELKVAQEACEVAKTEKEDLAFQNQQLIEDNEAMCRDKASQEVTIGALTAKLEEEKKVKALQEELESNVAGLDEGLKATQMECDRVRAENKDLVIQNRRLDETNASLCQDKASLKASLKAMIGALEAAKVENESRAIALQEDHKSSAVILEEDSKAVQKQCSVEKKENKDLAAQNKQLSETDNDLSLEAASSEESIELGAAVKLEPESHAKAVAEGPIENMDEYESKVAALVKDLETMRLEYEEMALELREIKRVNEELSKKHEELLERSSRLDMGNATQTQSLEEVREELRKHQSQHAAQVELLASDMAKKEIQYKEEIESLTEDLETTRVAHDSALVQYKQVSDAYETLSLAKEYANSRILGLTSKLTIAEKCMSSFTKSQSQHEIPVEALSSRMAVKELRYIKRINSLVVDLETMRKARDSALLKYEQVASVYGACSQENRRATSGFDDGMDLSVHGSIFSA